MPLFKKNGARAGWDAGRETSEAFQTVDANFAALEPSAGYRATAAANYALALKDRFVRAEKADGAQTISVPTNAAVSFEIGTRVRIEADTEQTVTIAGANGVTLRVIATKTLAVVGQYGVATLEKVGANEWIVSGDLAEA